MRCRCGNLRCDRLAVRLVPGCCGPTVDLVWVMGRSWVESTCCAGLTKGAEMAM